MRDELYTPDVSAWLKGREVQPADSEATARRVAARLPQVRQRSRWWPFPMLYRRSTTSAPIDMATTYAGSIPATNGHTPSVIGRTQSMLSPVKAIAAGAIVFAIGGVMLVGQPFDRPSVVPGAATDESPAAPVAVTATSAAGPCPGVETTETIGFIARTTGGYCNPTWDWSDDRLDGKVTWAMNGDSYTDGSGLTIQMFSMSFENDDGAWRMRPLPYLDFPDVVDTGADVWVLDGEGAYEGLTAVLVVDGYTPHGFIIDGDLPPAPENASTR